MTLAEVKKIVLANAICIIAGIGAVLLVATSGCTIANRGPLNARKPIDFLGSRLFAKNEIALVTNTTDPEPIVENIPKGEDEE